jgi:hypothetical protein
MPRTRIAILMLTSKMGELKYLSVGQNKNKNFFLIFFMFFLLWGTILAVKMM